ncbi:hypothetical protein F5Y04DRAFT_258894 [Hypomontagnella monticulosa]|nr:hypothetical protein F5Y04DRAFT_258894 [Hypomontagnella monticulosa]
MVSEHKLVGAVNTCLLYVFAFCHSFVHSRRFPRVSASNIVQPYISGLVNPCPVFFVLCPALPSVVPYLALATPLFRGIRPSFQLFPSPRTRLQLDRLRLGETERRLIAKLR